MAFILKNTSDALATYLGISIAAGDTYTVTDAQQGSFARDIKVLADLLVGKAEIDANGTILSGKDALELLNYIGHVNTAVQSVPYIGSKTFDLAGVTKKLFARNTGIQAAVAAGPNVINYTASYPWAKIVGVEIIGGETLDTASLIVYDTPAGTYSGVPNQLLNQFGFNVNVAPDKYERTAQFDADLYQGMVISFEYNSVSAKTLGINILMNEVK